MSELIGFLLAVLSVVFFVPALVLMTECLLAYLRPSAADRAGLASGTSDLDTVIVIPAHNEAGSIDKTISALQSQLGAHERIVVVADNCSDDTADIAANYGVTVLARNDLDRRGKGFALDHAIQSLQEAPPDVVIFLDADCALSANGVKTLSRLAGENRRPVQANYIMKQAEGEPSTGRRIAEFAWLVRGLVRPTGLAAMGMPCQLYGTGMAFPWEILRQLDLASGNIVEDMKLTVDLIKEGLMPMFATNVSVSSAFPSSEDAAYDQRKRWEHGHIATITRYGLPALFNGIVRLDIRRVSLALDVCVPPLALFMIMLFLTGILDFLFVVALGCGQYALLTTAISLAITAFGLFLAWRRFGKDVIDCSTMLMIPKYVWSKVSLYSSYLFNRQKNWNRAGRD